MNGIVARLLDDFNGRPIPRGCEMRFAEILQAVANGNATEDMALDVIDMLTDDKAT